MLLHCSHKIFDTLSLMAILLQVKKRTWLFVSLKMNKLQTFSSLKFLSDFCLFS